MNGVQFFFSCVTSVMSNAKSTRGGENESTLAESYPAIAYFVVFRECETCSREILFLKVHNEELDAEISRIRVRKTANHKMETAARQLFQALKDHNNNEIQQMLDVSNVYCYRSCAETSSDEEDDENDHEMDFTHLPNVPCRVFVVNESELLDRVATAVSRLQSDGLVIEMANSFTVNINGPAFSSNNDVAKLIKKIEKCMKICHHALYRSEVYTKPEGASFTFVMMMDVSSYLHKLLANELLRDQLITHF